MLIQNFWLFLPACFALNMALGPNIVLTIQGLDPFLMVSRYNASSYAMTATTGDSFLRVLN